MSFRGLVEHSTVNLGLKVSLMAGFIKNETHFLIKELIEDELKLGDISSLTLVVSRIMKSLAKSRNYVNEIFFFFFLCFWVVKICKRIFFFFFAFGYKEQDPYFVQRGCNIRTLQEVTHPSITLTQACLTSKFQ